MPEDIKLDLRRAEIEFDKIPVVFSFDTPRHRFWLDFIAKLAAEGSADGAGAGQYKFVPLARIEEELWEWAVRSGWTGERDNLCRTICQTCDQRLAPWVENAKFEVRIVEDEAKKAANRWKKPLVSVNRKKQECRLAAHLRVIAMPDKPGDATGAIAARPSVTTSDSSRGQLLSVQATASLIGRYPDAEELIIAAYFGKMFAEALRGLRTTWQIDRVRALFRDFDTIRPKAQGEMPRTPDALQARRGQDRRAITELRAFQGEGIKRMEIRFHRNQPCVRGILIRPRGASGFVEGTLEIYRQRGPRDFVDYSARQSNLILLNDGDEVRRQLMENFEAWFEFMWECCSYSKGKKKRTTRRASSR